MKNDASFKLVAAIIVAGVITALVSPVQATKPAAPAAPAVAEPAALPVGQ